MKKLLFAMLMMVSTGAHALQLPQIVYEVGMSSWTQFQIAITSGGGNATQVDNPALSGRVSLEIQDLDGSSDLWCGPNVNVSSITGHKTLPNGSWVLGILDALQQGGSGSALSATHAYCVNDGVAISTASITQIR